MTTTYWLHKTTGSVMKTRSPDMAQACATGGCVEVSEAEYRNHLRLFVERVNAQLEEGFTLFNLDYSRALNEARERMKAKP